MFPITVTLTIHNPADFTRVAALVIGPPAPAVQEAAKTAAQAVETPAPAPEGPLDYAVLQKAVFRLAQKAPAKCQAACEKMGVKTMRDLAPEKRRDALAIVEKFIDEVGA
jgi:hypothetical protein